MSPHPWVAILKHIPPGESTLDQASIRECALTFWV